MTKRLFSAFDHMCGSTRIVLPSGSTATKLAGPSELIKPTP